MTDEIESIESAVDELEVEDYSAVLELHKEANQLEYELGRLESELVSVTDEIAEIEAWIDEEDRLEDQLEDVTAQFEEQRTRIDRIEADAVEQFNDHMETVLELLDYPNLDCI